MVCSACGTRNLPDVAFCARCGARLAEEDGLAQPETPTSVAERQAAAARECLESGDLKRALESARLCSATHPSVPASHAVLGEVYLAIGAPEDALREFRRALELDPDLAAAREQAEVARRRIARPRASRRETRLATVLSRTGHLVPLAAGIAAAIVVFTVGAMLMAYRTSPRAQRLRAHAQEMARGRALYKQGRYAEAYEHFARAAELYPTDRETRRRAQDAARVAGIGTQGIGSLTSPPSVGAADAGGPKVTIETPILPSAWVGPRPDANASAGPSRASRPAQMPPPLDVPAPSGPDSPSTDLPLVPPPGSVVPDTVESITGHSRVDVHDPVGTPPDIGRPADQPVEPDEVVPAPKPKSTGGPIRIEFHPPKRVTGSAPQAGTGPRGDDLRREAQRLWDAGRPAEAATRFGEAATTYRQEAAWAGPDQAAKRQAAQSCDLARQACESQLQ